MASLADYSDTTLALAIGRWQQDALAEAYRRHSGAVHALARRVLGDVGAAEDVVQDVFVQLWHHAEKFDPERGSLRSFLLTQTHGRAVDRLRSDSSRRLREERQVRKLALAGYDVDDEVWDLVVADHVREAMSSLSPDQRVAIALAYFGGHTYKDVAVLLGESEGTIKSRIRAGLALLKVVLSESGVLERS